jgi:hypothetical protein
MKKGPQELKLRIFSRLDLTSKESLQIRELRLPLKEHKKRIRATRFESEPAQKLLKFMAEYDQGFYNPEDPKLFNSSEKSSNKSYPEPPLRRLSQVGSLVEFKKTKPFRYFGWVKNRRFSEIWEEDEITPYMPNAKDPLFTTEWVFWFRPKWLKSKSVNEVIRFFEDLFLVSEGDFGFLTMNEDHKNKNFLFRDLGGGKTSEEFVGHNLEVCLPGIYWANVFGKLYVDWFGEEKFKTLPCFYKEQLKDGSYFVQVAEDLNYYKTPEGERAVQEVLDHLGRDAFFDIRDPFRRCAVPDYVRKNRRSDDPLSV